MLQWTLFSPCNFHKQNQMFFMWSAYQWKEVRLGPILQQSSIRHNYQEQWQGRQLPSPPSPWWSHKLSQSIGILRNPQVHVGLPTNIQLGHWASKISTCRPTFSMCCLLWAWFDQTKDTAPIYRSRLSCLQYLRPQWFWVPLKAGRQRTQPPITIHFVPSMSQGGSIGIVLLVKLLTPMSPEMYLLLQSPPPHHCLHDNQRGSWAWGCVFPKRG